MDKKPEVSKPKPRLFKTLKKSKKVKRSQYVIGFMSDFPPEFLWLDGQIETDFIIYVEKSLILCGIDIVKNSQKTYHVLVYNSGLSFRCFLWWWHIKRLISSLLILLIAWIIIFLAIESTAYNASVILVVSFPILWKIPLDFVLPINLCRNKRINYWERNRIWR